MIVKRKPKTNKQIGNIIEADLKNKNKVKLPTNKEGLNKIGKFFDPSFAISSRERVR